MDRMLHIFISMIVTTLAAANKITRITHKFNLDVQCSAKYEIGDEIGRGSFGRVFIAAERQRNTPLVVLKTFSGKDAMIDWNTENEILTELDNGFIRQRAAPNGYRIRRFSQLNGHCLYNNTRAIVTDYIPVGLEQEIVKTRTTVEDIAIIYSLIQAVDQFHTLGFAHLDLKPENIRIDAENVVKLIDFGVSQHLSLRKNDPFVGTSRYKAPEVLYSNARSAMYYDKSKADTWSVGSVAYEILMRQPLRSKKNFHDIYKCLKAYNNIRQDTSNTQTSKFAYIYESFDLALYVQSITALHGPGRSTTFERTNPPVIGEAAWKCAYAVGFDARPEATLLAELKVREKEHDNNIPEKLTNLIFGKFLQFDSRNRMEMSDAMNVDVFDAIRYRDQKAHMKTARTQNEENQVKNQKWKALRTRMRKALERF